MDDASHFSMLDWRERISRSMLFCFFSSCIFRTRSAKESFRLMIKSSESLADGGRGGFRNVYDSSTCADCGVGGTSGSAAVWRRLGNDTLNSVDGASETGSIFSFSSKSGVDVQEIGRLFRGANKWKNMLMKRREENFHERKGKLTSFFLRWNS